MDDTSGDVSVRLGLFPTPVPPTERLRKTLVSDLCRASTIAASLGYPCFDGVGPWIARMERAFRSLGKRGALSVCTCLPASWPPRVNLAPPRRFPASSDWLILVFLSARDWGGRNEIPLTGVAAPRLGPIDARMTRDGTEHGEQRDHGIFYVTLLAVALLSKLHLVRSWFVPTCSVPHTWQALARL